MKYFNIAFELVILLNVYIQIKMIKREKYIYVIVVGIIIILAEIVYVSFLCNNDRKCSQYSFNCTARKCDRQAVIVGKQQKITGGHFCPLAKKQSKNT